MAFKPTLTYKGRPLVRSKNDIYYGNPKDPYVIFMQVLSTTKDSEGVEIADRIHITLLSTDVSKPPIERMVKQSDKNGLFNALDIGVIWLERALADKK